MHVTLVSTSDVHGYFRADDFRRPLLNTRLGLSRAVTVMNELRTHAAPDDVVIAIDNGDFIQGSPLTNYIEKWTALICQFTKTWQTLLDLMFGF